MYALNRCPNWLVASIGTPTIATFATNSMNLWLDYFTIFGQLQQWNFAQCNKNWQLRYKRLQNINWTIPKIAQRVLQFCQSGGISPNLVTLATRCKRNLYTKLFLKFKEEYLSSVIETLDYFHAIMLVHSSHCRVPMIH